MQNQNEDFDPTGYEGRGGALVEEARRLMQEDDGDAPRESDTGPKIKMNRIGKKGKKAPTTTAKEADKSTAQKSVAGTKSYAAEKSAVLGGFTEQDIEFMKKAI